MITDLDLLFRALASRTRMRILALLRDAPPATNLPPGLQPTDIARRLGIARTTASQHLRALLRLGLVRYWKKDRRKFYRPARFQTASPRSRLLRRVLDDLPDRFPPLLPAGPSSPARPGRRHTRPRGHGAAATPGLDGLWRLLTCLSHFRRILIVRHLAAEGPATIDELVPVADLRPVTVRYHLRKLIRRGAVVQEDGRFRLASGRPAPMRRLLPPALLPPGA